ncbi:MAG: hypothetical protein ABIS67_02725 [Candidatus Eisenbacteria bacterium]
MFAIALRTLLVGVIGLIAWTAPAQSQWQPNGVAVSGASGDVNLVISDGVGGAFIAWRNNLNSGDVWLQRLTAQGYVAPDWPIGGLPIAVQPGSQQLADIEPDGTGGVLVNWRHAVLDAPTLDDLFVQRVLADGSIAPGWPASGFRILAPDHQDFSSIAPDGLGGAYVVWEDYRAYPTRRYDVYAQHLLANGTVAPGWPDSGLAIAALPSDIGGAQVLADGSGGAYFYWSDDRNNPGGLGDTYAVRLNPDGTPVAGWAPTGNRLTLLQPRRGAALAPDGGLYLWTTTAGAPVLGFDNQYFLYRITPAGATSPGWPAGGVLLCNSPGNRTGASMESDGQGGVLMSWYDYRPPYDQTCGEIFALRVLPSGSLAPGWTANGTLVSDPTNPNCEYSPYITRDDQGGAYLVWNQDGPSRVHHLTASGQPAAGWPAYGVRLATSGAQRDGRIAADGEGGAIVAWSESCCGRQRVWAQRFVLDGIVAVDLALVSAVAEADRVTLEWYAADGAGLTATVERRAGASGWRNLGSLMADGLGHLHYEDRDVTPGERYAYRLAYREDGVDRWSAETLVEIPAAFEFALEGFRPNPAVGSPLISFTLPRAGSGRLEVFDLAGRRVESRDLAGLAAGRHVVRVAESAALPPAAYVVRLTHEGRAATSLGVVVR